MFGGYGDERQDAEFPEPHPDFVCLSHNTSDLPAALRQCAFLAFNSPAQPVGYDANPLVLIEAMMNGKTFLAQSGAPLLSEIADLGVVVETDEAWVGGREGCWSTRSTARCWWHDAARRTSSPTT